MHRQVILVKWTGLKLEGSLGYKGYSKVLYILYKIDVEPITCQSFRSDFFCWVALKRVGAELNAFSSYLQ